MPMIDSPLFDCMRNCKIEYQTQHTTTFRSVLVRTIPYHTMHKLNK